jgi:hypothetical protein
MYYCGTDYHKKYSVVSMINENGQTAEKRRILGVRAYQILTFSFPRLGNSVFICGLCGENPSNPWKRLIIFVTLCGQN